MTKERFDKLYTQLILELGLQFEKGMSLVVRCAPDYYSFASKIAEAAYKKGAVNVEIDLVDTKLIKARCKYQDIETVSKLPKYLEAIDKERSKEKWAFLAISDTENNTVLNNTNKDKLAQYTKVKSERGKTGRDGRINFEIPWCIVCYPLKKWAKQVLNSSTQDMRDLLTKILLLDKENPVKAWQEFDKEFKKGNEYLNSLKIKTLHYVSPITDLTVSLKEEAIWLGGSDECNNKPLFVNIPTFEHFSVPDKYSVNGYVTTTRPVTVLQTLCNDIRFEFKDGKVVKCEAKEGQQALDQYLVSDANAPYLGEVALVDERTPIAQSGQVFNTILYDENASCHIAIGAGYAVCLSNNAELDSEEKLEEYGCNVSRVHTDFMIGSSDLNIYATTYDGKEVQIYKNGQFTF
ncbi:MAG: aminopeptidase [Sphaerochaetaceae bacterium]|nr:aminopeptidase [Sphaerochaetaceae bacterium]